jgi:hypothetical protein
MSDLETARALRGTASYLRIFGWRKHEPGYDGGPRCLGGALLSVTGEHPEGVIPERASALGQAMGFDTRGAELALWNDAPERTLEEVLDRLGSTALGLEIRALAASATQPIEV